MYDISRFLWKNRVLVIYTPSYTYHKYLKTINKLRKKRNLKALYKRNIQIEVVLKNDFHIDLIALNGTVHERYPKLRISKIIETVDSMSYL